MNVSKLAGLSCLLVLTPLVWAQPPTMIVPRALWQRVAHADGVVVGKVKKFEAKTVATVLRPGYKNRVELVVATVEVAEGLLGTGDKTSLRVAFLKPAGAGLPQARLQLGQDACLFLTRHHEQPFYVLADWDSVLDKKQAGNALDMETVRKAAKLLADPKASLGSKDSTERFETAVLLLSRYTGAGVGINQPPRMEQIPAEESKSLLLALADGDWIKQGPLFGQMNPVGPLVNQILSKTGFKAPPGGFPPGTWDREAKKWLRDQAESYRIERPVAVKAAEK